MRHIVFIAYDDICRSDHAARDTTDVYDPTIDIIWSEDYRVMKIQPWLDENNLTIPLYQEFEEGQDIVREWLRFPDQLTATKFRLLFG